MIHILRALLAFAVWFAVLVAIGGLIAPGATLTARTWHQLTGHPFTGGHP